MKKDCITQNKSVILESCILCLARIFSPLALISVLMLSVGCLGDQHQDTEMPVVTDINWVADYYEGLRISEGENKLLLLYFGADWCGFCQKMDEEVLNTSEVSSVIHEKFIPVFLNVDLDDNSKLISNYRVTVTPTFIITSEQEEIIDIVIGFRDRKDFLEFLEG